MSRANTLLVICASASLFMVLSPGCSDLGLGASKKYELAVEDGVRSIPIAAFLDSQGSAEHFISYFKDGPQMWITVLLLGGKYRLTLQCSVTLRPDKESIESHGKGIIYVDVIGRVNSDGGMSFSDSFQTGADTWNELIKADQPLADLLDQYRMISDPS